MKIKKILVSIFCITIIIGIFGFETFLLFNQENEHQSSLANAAYDDILFDLNMIKIAVQTGDFATFSENLSKARSRLSDVDSLFLVKNQHTNYLTEVETYLDFLDSKQDFLQETINLRTDISNLTTSLKESYEDKSKLTRDELKLASERISNQKLNLENYNSESIKQIADATNTMLDNFSKKAKELSDCIDVCYKDAITKITTSLEESFKTFQNGVFELNSKVETEFNFEQINQLISKRPNYENSFSRTE